MEKTFTVRRLFKERFKEASVLPLLPHVGFATRMRPTRPIRRVWSWRELKSLGNTIGDLLARSQKLELDRWGPLIKKIGFTTEF